ncbi:MAG: response regulator [Cryomorphaceae bacterium]
MKKIIFLVDDDPIFQFGVERIVRSMSQLIELKVFNHGVAVLDFFDQAKDEELPDIMLLDLNMPIMNGWQVIQKMTEQNIHKIASPMRIYICSSSVNPADIQKVKRLNTVTDYIIKPISKAELEKLLETV